jgi:murein peptide amidase A
VCRTIGDGEYVVLMLASIHGNEAAGTPLLNILAAHVNAHPVMLTDVTLVLMPVVNPDGVENGKRYNTRGVDLNRNFPAENRQNSSRYGLNALSEPEALAIYQVINDTLPNHIVTLHEPLQCVDYDGPAKELATVMSEHCPLPVKKLGSRPGSLGSYAGVTLGIPTITFELPRNAAAQSPGFLWRFYGEALIQAVLHRH